VEREDRLTPALDEAKRRRENLHEALVGLEKAVSSPAAARIPAWTAQVTKRMVDLREAFDQHVFVTERPEGLYDEIMQRSPRLTGTVERLREEHPAIAEAIASTLGRLEGGELEHTTWPIDEARDDLQRLMGRVVRHRQHGADLVWEAYNVDIGGPE
jgi:hypothetical protein